MNLLTHPSPMIPQLNETPTIYLIDDDESFMATLANRLTENDYHAYTDSSISQFCQRKLERPCCVITDVQVSGDNAESLQRELVKRGDLVPVVFLTASPDTQTVVRVMKRGALAVLEKPCLFTDFCRHVETAIEHDQVQMTADAHFRSLDAAIASLTDRQHDVMNLAIQGLPNKAIATRLDVSDRTIERERATMQEALGAKSITQLALQVEEYRILKSMRQRRQEQLGAGESS